MFIFGQKKEKFILKDNLDYVFDKARTNKSVFSKRSTISIINVLSKLEYIWRKDGDFYKKALEVLNTSGGFSEGMNKKSLDIIPALFNKENLMHRVSGEIDDIDRLDDYTHSSNYSGMLKYNPLGVVLHVTAGNVFLGCIDSLLLGILTKNISLIKLSSSNQVLPLLFIDSLLLADVNRIITPSICLLSWKGGDWTIEDQFKKNVDGIITWGGEDMAASYAKNLAPNVKLIQHGPKISFHVISKSQESDMSDSFFDNIVRDIYMWDQSACANSQNIFIEFGTDINKFIKGLELAFERVTCSRGDLSGDEYTEIIKDYQLGLYEEFKTGNRVSQGKDFLICYDSSLSLTPSALNRSVKIKEFVNIDELSAMLAVFKMYLQTCGLVVSHQERGHYIEALDRAGVKRYTCAGEMLLSSAGAPHDGSFSLRDLLEVHAQEGSQSIEAFALDMVKNLSFYSEKSFKNFSDIPIIDSDILTNHSIHNSDAFLNKTITGGTKVFSTGGTSGKPKYCLYTNSEFDHVAKMLSHSYEGLGLLRTDKVLNLFMAGNLWSSFSAVQQALDHAKVMQFPLGGLASIDEMANLIKLFDINVIFGLPSTIINLLNAYPCLKIEKVFYAGEMLNQSARIGLSEKWGSTIIASAGYATVDVGPIGFQNLETTGNEHILFDDLIFLEVIDEQAIVSSKVRKAMPIIRYQTGDRVKIIERKNGYTKFEILGRIDQRINIWSSRIELNEILTKVNELYPQISKVQIIIKSHDRDGQLFDSLLLILDYKLKPTLKKNLIKEIFLACKDLSRTHQFDFLEDKFFVAHEGFLSNSRTGKEKVIFDLRL